ncbi:copper amine oxidase N-terminal domain-containing protein [Paenibacillus sp. TRM 82003]|nr:copper amine oxidase N-terminal domain-containing protein [Paenibacillus sp. TRM 82003]
MTIKTKVTTLIAASLLFAGVAGAASLHGAFEGNPIVAVQSEGVALTVEDVPAINYKGRTMVPIYMLRQLGAEVKWDGANETVDVSLAAGAGAEAGAAEPNYDADWMVFYNSIAYQYAGLEEYGEMLSLGADHQLKAFLSHEAKLDDPSYKEDAAVALEDARAMYDYTLEDARLDYQWAEENGFETDIVKIAKGYGEALELLEASMKALTYYEEFGKVDDLKEFRYNRDKAAELVQELRLSAYWGYMDFYNKIEYYYE